MNQKHLLRFIKKKMRTSPDEEVCKDKSGKVLTLKQVGLDSETNVIDATEENEYKLRSISAVLYDPCSNVRSISTVLYDPCSNVRSISTVLYDPCSNVRSISAVLYGLCSNVRSISTVLYDPCSNQILKPVFYLFYLIAPLKQCFFLSSIKLKGILESADCWSGWRTVFLKSCVSNSPYRFQVI